MTRDQIFYRLIAIADVLGDRVLDKGAPSIASQYLDKIGREPMKAVTLMHTKLIQHAHKFGPKENALIDMFGELMARLEIEDFNNKPLDSSYIINYYHQKSEFPFVGLAEAAEILGWSKQQVSEYIKRGKFPEPIHRLASGPIWTKKQIEDYRDARK